jgi:hypothetical protein
MNGHHQVAIWAGISAFFASMLSIGVIEVFNPDDLVKFTTSFLVAGITGASVYSKHRLDDARRENEKK